MAIRTVFASESGNQPASQLDNMYGDVWNAATIPCTPSITANAITLTPMTNANLPAAYNQHQRVGFTANTTSTGAVTAQIGSLGFLNVYVPGGLQANANVIVAGSYYELAYDPGLNASAGGWWIVVATGNPGPVLLNTLTASNSATLSDTTSFTSAFSSYEIVFINIVPVTTSTTLALLVHSGGSFRNTGYLGAILVTISGATAVGNPTTLIQLSQTTTVGANGLCGTLTVFNPSSGAVPVIFIGQLSHANGTVVNIVNTSGAWNTAAAVDGFQVSFSSGNISSGVIKIYGIF